MPPPLPASAGSDGNNSLQRNIGWVVLLLLFAGQILLFSASGVLAVQRFNSPFYYVGKQTVAGLIGLILMILLSRVRYQFWGKLSPVLLALQLGLVIATYFPGLGHQAQGASRWLQWGSFSFQPSELGKLFIVLYVAHLLEKNSGTGLRPSQWALRLLPVGLLLGLIFRQPDLGTTIVLTCLILGLFFLAGARPLTIALFTGGGGILAVCAMLLSVYRRRRLLAFLNPWSDPQGAGFQTIQSFVSIHSGSLFGVGLGNGNSKLFYLPEVHTDFIYALVAEELGFIGALVLLLVFLYLLYLLFRVSFQARDNLGCYVAFGLALSLGLQVCINLGGVTGLLPVKGLPLPFISWGRSALLVNLIMMGILLNIARQSSIIPSDFSPGPLK